MAHRSVSLHRLSFPSEGCLLYFLNIWLTDFGKICFFWIQAQLLQWRCSWQRRMLLGSLTSPWTHRWWVLHVWLMNFVSDVGVDVWLTWVQDKHPDIVGWLSRADWQHKQWVVWTVTSRNWLIVSTIVVLHPFKKWHIHIRLITFDCPSTWTLHGKLLSVACEFQHNHVFTWVLLVFLRCRNVLLTLIRLLSIWPLGTVVLFFRMGRNMEKGSTSESWIGPSQQKALSLRTCKNIIWFVMTWKGCPKRGPSDIPNWTWCLASQIKTSITEYLILQGLGRCGCPTYDGWSVDKLQTSDKRPDLIFCLLAFWHSMSCLREWPRVIPCCTLYGVCILVSPRDWQYMSYYVHPPTTFHDLRVWNGHPTDVYLKMLETQKLYENGGFKCKATVSGVLILKHTRAIFGACVQHPVTRLRHRILPHQVTLAHIQWWHEILRYSEIPRRRNHIHEAIIAS